MGAAKDVVDRVWAAMESGDLDRQEDLIDPEIEFRMDSEGGRGIGFYLKVRDGRIRSWHVYADNLAFMAQLGLIPAAA